MAKVLLRPPTFSKAPKPAEFEQPSIQWLAQTWHVTHSTLPMWKSKRNVRIKYTPLPPSRPGIEDSNTDRLDDHVSYQDLKHDKISTIDGVDTAVATETTRGEWDWRGKGWLKIASSHWEILGWGEEADGNKWAVTMFAKTMFTPAGLDFYSASSAGLQSQTVSSIKQALTSIEDDVVKELAGKLFEVTIDGARTD